MTSRQCLALQLYVIAVARYVETPSPPFEKLLFEQAQSLEEAFSTPKKKIILPPIDLLPETSSTLLDIL